MFKLVGTDGDRLYSFDLEPGSYQVGRGSEVPFCVPDKTVSRAHALVEVSPTGLEIYVSDSGSHNGTTVNGVKLLDRHGRAARSYVETGAGGAVV